MTKVVIICNGENMKYKDKGGKISIKPLTMVGDRPILQHIIDAYVLAGFSEFVVPVDFMWRDLVGYFKSRYKYVEISHNKFSCQSSHTVFLVETGMYSKSGATLKLLQSDLCESFMVTYGDRISDINNMDVYNLSAELHKSVLTAIHPTIHSLVIAPSDGEVMGFGNKTLLDVWDDGGYMCLQPDIFQHLSSNPNCVLEDILNNLALNGELIAFRHEGLWMKFDSNHDFEVADSLYGDDKFVWIGKE